MKKLIPLFFIVLFLFACAPSQEQIEKAIAETQTAKLVAITNTPLPTNTPKPLWAISSSTDEMTGEKSHYASSPKIMATNPMDFPYNDVVAWIGVSCSGNQEWAYFGFSTSPNLVDTEIEDGYDRILTRIKWGEVIINTSLLQKWGNNFLEVSNDEIFIDNLISSTTLLLELDWYGEGLVYFKFPLAGAAEGIRTIRARCAN